MERSREIIEKIRSRYPDVSFVVNEKADSLLLKFKTEWQLDYYHWGGIHLVNNSPETSIVATLVHQSRTYFWYEP